MKKKIAFTRLKNALKRAPNLPLFEAIWAIDRLQSDERISFKYFNKQPKEILTTDPTSEYYLHKFQLENLMNFSLMISQKKGQEKTRIYNFREWDAFADLHKKYLAYVNTLSGVFLDNHSIDLCMRRIKYQQIRSMDNSNGKTAFYRIAYMILGDEIREHFLNTIKVEPNDYLSHIFILWAHFCKNSILQTPYDCSEVGISNVNFEVTLKHISRPLDFFEKNIRGFRGDKPYDEYAPSIF